MPPRNCFRHQVYQACAPVAPYELLTPDPRAIEPIADQERRRWNDQLRAAGVAAVYLMHGTFVGQDALGVARKLTHIWPFAGRSLQQFVKRVIDGIAHDAANYTAAFADQLQRAINVPERPTIPVKLFYWSSENLHVARADAAIQLLDMVAQADPPVDGRVLVWGHSHAGNVLALLTNLLGAPAEVRDEFFRACRYYYRLPYLGIVDAPAWPRVAERWFGRDAARPPVIFDIATFGTPIRYGWDALGYGHLLHFINHRPQPGLAPYVACLPQDPQQVLSAEGGDYIQLLGIAGTNLIPDGLSWRAWNAELRLHRLVQHNVRSRQLWQHVRCGVRVADEGTTLLVDYGDARQPFFRQLAGHAVYTRIAWLPFHLREIMNRFYAT